MKTQQRFAAVVLACLSLQLTAINAQAAGVEVYLNESNERSIFESGLNYLTVAITDGLNGAIDFRVTTNPDLNSKAASNFGIQAFSFNFGDSGATSDNLVLPEEWVVKQGDGSHSIFGMFDVNLLGTGTSRCTPRQSASAMRLVKLVAISSDGFVSGCWVSRLAPLSSRSISWKRSDQGTTV